MYARLNLRAKRVMRIFPATRTDIFIYYWVRKFIVFRPVEQTNSFFEPQLKKFVSNTGKTFISP